MIPFPISRLPTLEQIRAERERRRQQANQQSSLLSFYHDPSEFAVQCIRWPEGEHLTPYQRECLSYLQNHARACIRGPHGLGKTAMMAILIHWFALTRDAARQDWKCVTTASAWRQLTKYLWPEVHKWSRRLNWLKIGRPPYDTRTELLTLELKLHYGSAFAVASDVPDLIEGAHADQLLYVFDESKSIPSEVFDAAEGAFAGGQVKGRKAMSFVVSTPGPPRGRFYDIQSRKPGYEEWKVRHVTIEEALAARRVDPEWVEQRRRQWGEESALFKNRVLGEFAEGSSDALIPLSWVEAAVERWYRLNENHQAPVELTSVGVDLAWGTSDDADRVCMALRTQSVITQVVVRRSQPTMRTVGEVRNIVAHYGGVAIVDVIGAAGVYGRLMELGVPTLAFNAAKRAVRIVDGMETWITDQSGELRFANMRSAAWYHLRELLDPDNGAMIALPPDDDTSGVSLTQELIAPTWSVLSDGRIQVEEKSRIIRKIGRSPDCADAVVMAFALELLQGSDTEWEVWTLEEETTPDLKQYIKEHGVYWPTRG